MALKPIQILWKFIENCSEINPVAWNWHVRQNSKLVQNTSMAYITSYNHFSEIKLFPSSWIDMVYQIAEIFSKPIPKKYFLRHFKKLLKW